MASTKDTFEPRTFGAGTFATGAWRGSGVDVSVVSGPFCVAAAQIHVAAAAAADVFTAGVSAAAAFVAGDVESEVNC